MRNIALMIVVAVALVATACGNGDGSVRMLTRDEPTTTRATEMRDDENDIDVPSKFTGVHAGNYRTAYTICGAFSPEHLRDDLGAASTDPVDIAEAYAEGKEPAFRQAPFEGCLHALIDP